MVLFIDVGSLKPEKLHRHHLNIMLYIIINICMWARSSCRLSLLKLFKWLQTFIYCLLLSPFISFQDLNMPLKAGFPKPLLLSLRSTMALSHPSNSSGNGTTMGAGTIAKSS